MTAIKAQSLTEYQVASDARDAEICALYRAGATLSAIGRHFGLSYEGVRKIAAKAGLTKCNAGLAARKAAKPAIDKREITCRRTYECSVQERSEVTAEQRRTFLQHRKNVKRDGVAWRLSLREWRALWLASGKWNRRGQGSRSYGMTRIAFDRPVELGNVEIVTNREAVRRARARSAASALVSALAMASKSGRDSAGRETQRARVRSAETDRPAPGRWA